MKILKVIVDELPETCEDYQFFYENEDGYIGCELEIGLKYLNRPSDCPLQTERTCGNCKYRINGSCTMIASVMIFYKSKHCCTLWEAKP